VQRNREMEQTQGPPASNSAIQLPFIIVNTSKKIPILAIIFYSIHLVQYNDTELLGCKILDILIRLPISNYFFVFQN
jgi:hypothetical protein